MPCHGLSKNFDKLDCFLARTADHHRPGLSELVWIFKDVNSLIPQLVHPGVEIGDAQGKVVIQVPECAQKWLGP